MNLINLSMFVFVFSVGSCAFYHEKDPGDPTTISVSNTSWNRVSVELFQRRCVLCHGSAGGLNFESYSGVFSNLSRIQDAVLTKQSMPPDSPLTSYEQKLFTTWIDAGTPQ